LVVEVGEGGTITTEANNMSQGTPTLRDVGGYGLPTLESMGATGSPAMRPSASRLPTLGSAGGYGLPTLSDVNDGGQRYSDALVSRLREKLKKRMHNHPIVADALRDVEGIAGADDAVATLGGLTTGDRTFDELAPQDHARALAAMDELDRLHRAGRLHDGMSGLLRLTHHVRSFTKTRRHKPLN
jgi:hypothetical protein